MSPTWSSTTSLTAGSEARSRGPDTLRARRPRREATSTVRISAPSDVPRWTSTMLIGRGRLATGWGRGPHRRRDHRGHELSRSARRGRRGASPCHGQTLAGARESVPQPSPDGNQPTFPVAEPVRARKRSTDGRGAVRSCGLRPPLDGWVGGSETAGMGGVKEA